MEKFIMLKDQNTKERILDIAENLIMSWGYNGFSYKDISLIEVITIIYDL